jgi:hypothetical protein
MLIPTENPERTNPATLRSEMSVIFGLPAFLASSARKTPLAAASNSSSMVTGIVFSFVSNTLRGTRRYGGSVAITSGRLIGVTA